MHMHADAFVHTNVAYEAVLQYCSIAYVSIMESSTRSNNVATVKALVMLMP